MHRDLAIRYIKDILFLIRSTDSLKAVATLLGKSGSLLRILPQDSLSMKEDKIVIMIALTEAPAIPEVEPCFEFICS